MSAMSSAGLARANAHRIRALLRCCLGAAAISAGASAADAPPPGAFTATPALFGHAGWLADNGLAVAGVGADAGARLLRFELGGKPLLWADASAVGDTGDPTPGGISMWQYRDTGGVRVWPGPQAQWKRHDAQIGSWPPPPAIDHGAYRFFPAGDGTLDAHGPAEVHPHWRCSGMQLAYSYHLDPAAARLSITTTLSNVSPYPQRWSQWLVAVAPVTVRADPAAADTVVWPFRGHGASRFGPRNYLAQNADYDDAMWQPDAQARVMRSRCLGRSGKISGDSDGGWIAWQDGGDGTVLVVRFPEAGALEGRVPEGWSSVAVNMLGEHSVEVEAMTPELDLDPGAISVVTWQLCACRAAGSIVAVSPGGVTTQPLRVERAGAELRVSGSFGAFAKGTAALRCDASEVASWPCSPTAPLVIDQRIPAAAGKTFTIEVTPPGGRPELLGAVDAPR